MFRIRKGAQNVVTIAPSGDVTFAGSYSEGQTAPAQVGELLVRKGASTEAVSVQRAGQRDLALRGRLFERAVFPGQGLQLRNAAQGVEAEFDAEGDLYIRGRVTNLPVNPALPGAFAFDSVVYAAPGLVYPASLSQYAAFQSPTAGFATRTIDISDFANLGSSPWPFTNTGAPINGLLRIPHGSGPFPLALIVHGNHSPNENSTPGYVYLLELLASHGIVAGSVDCNFLNGFNAGENDGRAIVHLEHVKQFRIWNQQAGHPLFGKLDLSKIMILGHSRGGEGVGHASAFNALNSVVPDAGDPAVPLDGSRGLGPYHFSLKAVVAIAPTENQYQPVGGRVVVRDNYFIIHGSRDADVWDFQGYQTYDRAQPINLAQPTQPAPGFKTLLWLYGANHNQFNSVWAPEGTPTITRAEQENVAKVYFSALAQALLLGRSQLLGVFKDATLAHVNGWIPTSISVVSQFQDRQRVFLLHYEEDANLGTPSPPVGGTISLANLVSSELSFNQGASGELFQQTRGLKLDWTTATGRYDINVNVGGLPGGKLHVLALRAGQSGDAKNQVGRNQDFRIELSDGTHSHSVRAAQFQPLLYPEQLSFSGARRAVMQTVRVPLRVFAEHGVDIRNIRRITLFFDQPIAGTALIQGSMYFDEIQLSH